MMRLVPRPLTGLTLGSAFVFVSGVFVTVILPALDPEVRQPTGSAQRYTAEQQRGREIYIREGCWYCHTQQVRPPEAGISAVVARGDIGPPSSPGDYVQQKPVLWGTQRQGPDLTYLASREPYGSSREWHVAHLAHPRAFFPDSIMPSYAHLPPADLEPLADYLLTLK